MSLMCLVSAHGSPGVTTTALALASVWRGDEEAILVEADAFGGVVSARFGLADTPGLISLAAAARGGIDGEIVERHAQRLPGGLPVLVAPPSADQATAVLRDLAPLLVDWSGSGDMAVIADCGRVGVSPSLPLLLGADRVLVVCRPTVDQLRPVADRIRTLEGAGVSPNLLLVGDSPYRSEEVANALDVTVAGTVAFDPITASALAGQPGSRSLRKSRLVRSIVTLACDLGVHAQSSSSSVVEA